MIKKNNSFLINILFWCFAIHRASAADSNQLKINDTFHLNTTKYIELINEIIEEGEVSKDSGHVNASFYIQTVRKILFFIKITFI